MDYGYSTPTPGASRGSEALFADVDWRTTRAYGLGINGLYLNLKGRERDGIIQSGKDADQLTDELIHHLTGIRDPDTGTAVISRVCRARDIYSGPHMGNAPDLVVCYAPGYRASWDTVLGKYPQEHILDNLDPWSGDHSMDSSHLQGVFLSNRPITTTKPALEDIAPTLLSLFGASHNPAMTGRIIMDGGDPERKQAKESTHV
jgi:predicted AlkP superfamily phosphohydrolase/phosphomutase